MGGWGTRATGNSAFWRPAVGAYPRAGWRINRGDATCSPANRGIVRARRRTGHGGERGGRGGGTARHIAIGQLRPVRKWVVYLLPHSHVDIGYTHVQTDVEKSQWKYLDMAIDTVQQSADYPAGARFKWNVEVLWAVDSYLQQATPEQRQRFIDAVQAGQVGLQALYGNQLTGLCRPEELLRLLFAPSGYLRFVARLSSPQ